MTTITALPTAPSRDDPATFATRADAWVAALAAFVTETNTVASEVNTAASNASTSETNAAASYAAADLAKLAAQGAANFVGTWNSGTAYTIGQCVFRDTNSNRYVARTNNTNKAPESNATDWLNITNSGTVTSVAAGTGVTVTGTPTVTPTVNVDKATNSNFWAGTSNKVLTADVMYAANAPVTSTGSSAWTPNFNVDGRNFARTLSGSQAINNPSAMTVGQSGYILIKENGTGGYSITSWGAYYKFPGGTPTITTTPNAVNVFSYAVETATSIVINYLGSYT